MPSKAVNLANISSGSILTADAVNERIGIGTTTPSKKLEVVGDSTISGNATIGGNSTISGNLSVGGTVSYEDVTNIDSVGVITAQSGVSIADSIFHTGDTNTAIRFPAADTFTVETNGSEKLRITSEGRIQQPAALSEDLSPNSQGLGQLRLRGDGTYTSIAIGSTTTTLYNSANRNLVFSGRGPDNPNIRIASSGQIHMGTPNQLYSSIAANIHMYGGTDVLQIKGSGGVASLRFTDVDKGNTYAIGVDDGSNPGGQRQSHGGGHSFTIFDITNDVYRFNIKSNGDVGINTSNPRAKLQVAGSSMFGPEGTGQYQGIQLLNGRDSSANVATGFIDFRNNLNIPDAHLFVDHGTDGGSTIIVGTTPAGDRTSDRRAERLRITSAGNVGINESIPLAKLHIDGSGDAPCLILPDSTNSRFSTGFGNINVSGVGQRLDFYAGDSGSNTANLTSAARRMSLTAQGRLGIGSDAPVADLDIHSEMFAGFNNGIRIYKDASANTPGSNGSGTKIIEFNGSNTGGSTEIGVLQWKNGDEGQLYTAASIASFNEGGSKSGNLVFCVNNNGDDERVLTMTRGKVIDLDTNTHIRGGFYFKADGATGTVNVNTSSSTLISWLANTIYSNGQGWSRTATTVNVPATGYYMVTFNGRLTSGAIRTNVIFRFNVNGTDLTNDMALNNYVRFDSGNTESSVNLTAFLLLNAGDDIGVSGQQEGNSGTVNLNKEQASLSLVLVG